MRAIPASLVLLAFGAAAAACSDAPPARAGATSAAWLGLLPDGETKRRFVLDCTGCHVFDAQYAREEGRARTEAEWREIIERMLRYAGPTTGFPVISDGVEPQAMSRWLVEHLELMPAEVMAPAAPEVTEYLLPVPQDLAHDVAVDGRGRVVVTGMMSHRMYVLDPVAAAGSAAPAFVPVDIPVPKANPRAVEIDAQGNWWVVLGTPQMLARYEPGAQKWTTYDVGAYPHSVALGPDGSAWYNAHFSRDPEIIGRVVPSTGAVETATLPAHPAMAAGPGGPIPYEIRVAPDGRVWLSELQGNRLVAWDPATRQAETFDMPVSWSGPRRFDIDAAGIVWIPSYTTNQLVRLDPATRRFTAHELPLADSVPYVVRVDGGTGVVWIGTAAADAVFAYDPLRGATETYRLPSRGALVRHLAIDPRTHQVWIAYGGAPGIASRIARLVPRRAGGVAGRKR